MKGKYITTQILLACLSKPVVKPAVKISYPTTRVVEQKHRVVRVSRPALVEA